jgi:hypothetical protein
MTAHAMKRIPGHPARGVFTILTEICQPHFVFWREKFLKKIRERGRKTRRSGRIIISRRFRLLHRFQYFKIHFEKSM